MTVASIQYHSGTIANAAENFTAALTGTPALVVFPMGSGASGARWDAAQLDGFIAEAGEDPPYAEGDLWLRRDAPSGSLDVSAHVVEFDSSVNVYKVAYNYVSAWTGDHSFSIGATVDATKAFCFAGKYCDSADGTYDVHLVRARLTDNLGAVSANPTHVTLSRQGAPGTIDGHFYVLESDDFSVQQFEIDPSGTTSTTATLSTTVDSGKTFLMGSWESSDTGRQNAINTCDVWLEDVGAGADTVTLDVVSTSNSIVYTGYAVELTGSTVTHGSVTSVTAETQHDITVDVDSSVALPIISGNDGTTTQGTFPSTTSSDNDMADASLRAQVTSDTNLQVLKLDVGGETNYTFHWSIIEWDTGGAPPATPRRVMVVS